MLSVNVASIQGLVNELQDMKRRKSQLILELQNLERDEFGVVQRLQIELDLASEISCNVRTGVAWVSGAKRAMCRHDALHAGRRERWGWSHKQATSL
jgi:hypothetical protein